MAASQEFLRGYPRAGPPLRSSAHGQRLDGAIGRVRVLASAGYLAARETAGGESGPYRPERCRTRPRPNDRVENAVAPSVPPRSESGATRHAAEAQSSFAFQIGRRRPAPDQRGATPPTRGILDTQEGTWPLWRTGHERATGTSALPPGPLPSGPAASRLNLCQGPADYVFLVRARRAREFPAIATASSSSTPPPARLLSPLRGSTYRDPPLEPNSSASAPHSG